MTNINLYQGLESDKKNKENPLGLNLTISLALLFLTLAVWTGSMITEKVITSKGESLSLQFASEQNAIIGQDNLQRVADFQRRADLIKKNIENKTDLKVALQNLQKNVVSGVVVGSFEFNKGTMNMTLIADTFASVSRQIVSLKKSENFSGLTVSNIARKDNKISFDVELIYKK